MDTLVQAKQPTPVIKLALPELLSFDPLAGRQSGSRNELHLLADATLDP